MNPVNRYLQHLSKNSPSGLVQTGAKIIHGVGKAVDTVGGFSAGKVKAQAELAKHMASQSPNKYSTRVAIKLHDRAENMRKNTRDARILTGIVGTGLYASNKAGQSSQDDVYSSYPNY